MSSPPNGATRPRVLVLARSYPNSVLPGQGLWVARFVRASLPIADPIVVSPTPRVLPGIPIPEWQRLRRVPAREVIDGVEVHYPRVLAGLSHYSHFLDAKLMLPGVRKLVRRLHTERRFELIHAHFIYPEGVVAAKLGGELGIPVVTTEHSHWRPWLDDERLVRSQVLNALAGISVITTVSNATRLTVLDMIGPSHLVELLPNVLDETAFVPSTGEPRARNRILFVGIVRHVKGLDMLVRALAILLSENPDVRLRVIGSTLTRSYRRDETEVKQLAVKLGLIDRIEFIDHLSPPEISSEMRQAAVLAVPSRRESFSAVTIEALASGTPVVATRCGGPEELLDDATGKLVPVDDPQAMADALGEVLRRPERFDPLTLRARVLPRYGFAATTVRLNHLYRSALANRP